MEDRIPSINELFPPLIGLSCWNVKQGYSSMLTLEFGDPSLEIREPRDSRSSSPRVRKILSQRHVTVRGQWHLWIYCCGWKIHMDGEEIAGHESEDEEIAAACRELDGQILDEVALGPGVAETRFRFDLGGQLTTKPLDDELLEQWLLYCPDGNVYTLRSDGATSLGPETLEADEDDWSTAV
jgi:hypothetical protein